MKRSMMKANKGRPLQKTPRCRRALWAMALGVFMSLSTFSPEVRGASASEIRSKYKNAKKLYADGKYEKAITAFKEVKVLKYHPILDYRIGQCYESLGQLKLAITSYELYVKYHGKFPPGKNHPTKKEVKTRIEGLRLRLKGAPPPTPAPTPGTPTDGGSGPPGTDPPSPGPPTQPGTDSDGPGGPNTGGNGSGGPPPGSTGGGSPGYGGHHPPDRKSVV